MATCSVNGADLGEWLVQNGLALDWPQYSKGKYGADQRDAEQAGRGISKGSYVEPWLYRDAAPATGRWLSRHQHQEHVVTAIGGAG